MFKKSGSYKVGNCKGHSQTNHNVTEAAIYVTGAEDFRSCQSNHEQQPNHTTSVLSNQHQTENGVTTICSTVCLKDMRKKKNTWGGWGGKAG